MLARLCRTRWPKKSPPHRCGPARQAPTNKRQGLRKNSFAPSKFHRRGEHCSPAKALRYHKAPRVEQSPTPTINRKKMRLNSTALSQFHRRGGALLRPPWPHLPPPKITPAPRGTPLPPHPKRPFCRKNENSLKNLPQAANKLTLVSVTFHPRAFIINLSKHCLPRVQNGAAAWF